jgi:hypothetical protein
MFCFANCTVYQMTNLMKYVLRVDRFSIMTRGVERCGCNFVHDDLLFVEPFRSRKIKTIYEKATVYVGRIPGMANVSESECHKC